MSGLQTWEHSGQVVRDSVEIRAAPEQVWAAWTEAQHVRRWFADEVKGDAIEGQVVTWIFERFRLEIPSTVMEATAPRRLVLRADTGAPASLLQIDITAVEGATIVEVQNSGFAEDEAFEDASSGWRMALAILALYVERHFGEDRNSFLAVTEGQFGYEHVYGYFRDPELMKAWLTTEGAVREPGDSVRLILRDGRVLTGRVLAATGREVALEWSEIGGVLELKAFAFGEGKRALCLRGSGWGLARDEAAHIETSLAAALDRLRAVLGID
jgi:uncharacterized protein YndB with AHSA1/START domain